MKVSTASASWAAGLCVVLALIGTPPAAANDRLPKRLRAKWHTVSSEVQRYMRFMMAKIWRPQISTLVGQGLDAQTMLARSEEMADEIVHLLLPEARKLTRDVVFGTGNTHLRFEKPELREEAMRATLEALKHGRSAATVPDAVEELGRVAENALEDRLEQALTEEMEDYAQQWVETGGGLTVGGRSRAMTRPLPEKWREPYAKARTEVHRYTYWWLRKRKRLALQHMSSTMSREELDKARHEGPMWRLASAISQEAWAQNRLRMDFRWGRPNWEIDRRRIRRRMDQDLAQAAWAMTRLVKELGSPETTDAVDKHLRQRLREELEKPEWKQKAEDFPTSGKELRQGLAKLTSELDPIWNGAMDKVPLPPDMTPEQKALARQNGRRYAREEIGGALGRALTREAAPHAAAKRAKDKLGVWAAEALSRFEPRSDEDPEAARRRARAHVRREAAPKMKEEIAEALRAAGQGELDLDPRRMDESAREVIERFKLNEELAREVDRQTGVGGAPR